MSSGVKLQRIEDANGRYSPVHLTIELGHLLDYLPHDAQKEFVGYAVANGELLKILCQEIAGTACDGGDPPTGDIWMGSQTRGEMRVALAPLMGPAIAEELKLAREKAELYENAHRLLRSLAHISQMSREACDQTERIDRNNQWSETWPEVYKMFPEYAPKTEAK